MNSNEYETPASPFTPLNRLKCLRATTIILSITCLVILITYVFILHDRTTPPLSFQEATTPNNPQQQLYRYVSTVVMSIWVGLALFWLRVYPKLVAIALAAAALATCIFIQVDGVLMSLVVGERSIVDFSAAPIFWFASILLFWAFFSQEAINRSKWWLALAVIFFICAGEESSWLQQYIKYDTPEALRAINKQGEMSFHNVGSSRLVNSCFLLAVSFLFLVCPELQRCPAKTDTTLRVFFSVFALYFLMRVLMPHEEESAKLVWAYRSALFTMVILIFTAPALRHLTFIDRPLTSFLQNIRFGSGFQVAAWILFLAYIIYGIRFQSLGDLRWQIPTALEYPTNIDDELFEFYGAVLSVLLAWQQLPIMRPPDARSCEKTSLNGSNPVQRRGKATAI